MKLLVLMLMMSLTGCAQLLQGQAQPVKLISKDGVYFTSCSGMAETMGMCFDKAQKTCNGKYEIIKEFHDSTGVHRELTFQCKK